MQIKLINLMEHKIYSDSSSVNNHRYEYIAVLTYYLSYRTMSL